MRTGINDFVGKQVERLKKINYLRIKIDDKLETNGEQADGEMPGNGAADPELRLEKMADEADVREKETRKELAAACPECGKEFSKGELRKNLYVCPGCGHYYGMPPEKRIMSVVDPGSFRVFRYPFPEVDPLHFEGYLDKKRELQEKSGQDEAVFSGVGKINGRKAVIAVMNSRFLMGSMGIVVGEEITMAIEYADKNKLPLIIFTASGGARMQEGILSLMQMAKTSAAMERFQNRGGLYIACLTHPTTGGVSASFAGLGDITLAEPGALVGFAGPKVIEQTIRQKLPAGFQRAEYLEEHGFVDQVVARSELRSVLSQLLLLHSKKRS